MQEDGTVVEVLGLISQLEMKSTMALGLAHFTILVCVEFFLFVCLLLRYSLCFKHCFVFGNGSYVGVYLSSVDNLY